MIKKLEDFIESYKRLIERTENIRTKNEYNEAYMQGYKEGLELGLGDLQELLIEAKLEKDYND